MFQDGTEEFCVDEKTNLKEGPSRHRTLDGKVSLEHAYHGGKPDGIARSYAPDGSLLSEDTFVDGDIKSVHFTLAGIKDQIAQLNSKLRAGGDVKGEFRVVDERTLEYRNQVDGPTASVLAKATEAQANATWNSESMKDLMRRGPCRMFTFGIQTVLYRYVDPSGHEIATHTVTPADCN